MASDLLPRAAVARACGVSQRTLMRHWPSSVPWVKIGRGLFLPPHRLAAVMEALAWQSPSAVAAQSTTRAAPSASAGRRSPSGSSQQDVVAALTRKLLPTPKRPASGKNTLKAITGGRGA